MDNEQPAAEPKIGNPLQAEKTDTIDHAVSKLLKKPEVEAPVTQKAEPEDTAEEEDYEDEGEPKSEESDSESEDESDDEGDDYEPEDEPSSEGEETPAFYSVKIDGEEYEVSLDELRSGYQRQKDYTKKTQAIAEERKATEAKAKQLEQLHNEYLNQAQLANELLNRDLKAFEKVDWETLKQEDPVGFMQKRIELEDIQRQQYTLRQQAQQAIKQREEEQSKAFQEYVKAQQAEMTTVFPDWKDNDKREAHQLKLADFARSNGFTDEELSNVVSARDLKILDMARKYADIQRNRKGADKKAKPAIRKIVKPNGKAPKGESKRKQIESRRDNLRKSGSIRDAAALMYELQTQKAINKPRG